MRQTEVKSSKSGWPIKVDKNYWKLKFIADVSRIASTGQSEASAYQDKDKQKTFPLRDQ